MCKNINLKTFKTFIAIILLSLFVFTGCADKKSEKINNRVQSASKSSKKKKSGKENKKITKVRFEAFVGNDTIIFNDQINQNTIVSLFRTGIAFKYSDSDKKEILVSFSGPDFYNNIPRSFNNQLQSLTRNELISKDIYKSKLVIYKTPGDSGIYLYKGTLNLKQFTDDLIEIDFKGTGFPRIDPTIKSNAKYFMPMKGTIVIKDYNMMDAR